MAETLNTYENGNFANRVLATGRKTRTNIRSEKADKVCREARWQIATYGGIVDNKKLATLVIEWLKYGLKNKYARP